MKLFMKRTEIIIVLAGIFSLPVISAFSAEATNATSRPNILFAVADDWGYGHAGAYGCKWVKTPAFDRVAAQGLLFTHAYTPNAKCAPSRACILTGRNSWQLGAAANHICFFPPEYKTSFEALGENNYFVGFTAKGWSPGVAKDAQGKLRNMTGKAFNARTAQPQTKGIGPNDYAANFADFLDAAPTNQPWCFWYGSLEPHRDYEFGSGAAKGGKKLSDVDRVPGYWPDDEMVRNDMLDYAFEAEHFDRHLERMLADLERRGQLSNTLVIVTSDHGMPFPRVKGQEYEFSNHIPLAMMWRGRIYQPGRTVGDFISFIDLAPTLVELAGLKWEQTGMAPATGHSLTDILFGDKDSASAPPRDHVLIGKERHDIGRPNDWGYPIRGIVKDGMIYLRNYETNRWPAGNPETGYLNCDAGATKTDILNLRRANAAGTNVFWSFCFGKRVAEELYDFQHDPDCLKNLADNPQFAAVKQKLESQMVAELKAQEDPRMSGRGDVFEKYPYAFPAQQNFYERFMRGEKPKAEWIDPSDFEKAPL